MPETSSRRVVLFLLSASVTLNPGLGAYTYSHTRNASAHAEEPQGAEGSQPIKVGAVAPIVKARNQSGAAATVDFRGRQTLLYVITPSCGWCARNTANINALWKQRSADYQFVGLSLKADGLAEYLRINPLSFDVHVADQQTILDYGLGTTPALIVVNEAGVVKSKFNGAWGSSSLPAMENYFKVKLPGIAQ